MKISKMIVKNYRRFKDSEIDMSSSDLSILAGANNSGKTSLIQLLNVIFNNKNNLSENDISIDSRQQLIKKILEDNISEIDTEEKYTEFLFDFFNTIGIENYEIRVQFILSYLKNDNISIFSDYLMDLDETKKEFYFEYRYEFNMSLFQKEAKNYINELYELHKKYLLEKTKNEEKESKMKFESIIYQVIGKCLENKYYFSNDNFKLRGTLEFSRFRKLFNFGYISADRELDDENLKNKKITSSIISGLNSLENTGDWGTKTKELEKGISEQLLNSDISSILDDMTNESLKILKQNIDNVGENQIDSLAAVIDFSQDNLIKLINDSVAFNYIFCNEHGTVSLTEESQGLGLSNLIYISLQVLAYQNNINDKMVNLFVIEEPEAHMHVQMQRVLIDFLQDLFCKENKIQAIITTHSNEIVKTCDLASIKIIRPIDPFINMIVDLKTFIDNHSSEKKFFETFFNLNFSNLIFCDYAILYEGDTERMYIESLISRGSEYKNLSKKYITYCQVGGAHGHKYISLLDNLKIKACIFTDIDYNKERMELENIKNDKSSNHTLNKQCKLNSGESVEVANIYDWQKKQEKDNKKIIRIYTQTSMDGYARTLEEAMLYSYISTNKKKLVDAVRKIDKDYSLDDVNVFTPLPKMFWKILMKDTDINISLPSNKLELDEIRKEYELKSEKQDELLEEAKKSEKSKEILTKLNPVLDNQDEVIKRSIRQIVKSINKTNFMYSVIIKDNQFKFLPDYVKKGLDWL